MRPIKLLMIFLFVSVIMTGCYTQLATREYEEEDYGYNNPDENYDEYSESDTVYEDENFEDEGYSNDDSDVVINNYYDPYSYPSYRRYYGGFYPRIVIASDIYFGSYWNDPFYYGWWDPWYPYPGCIYPAYYYYPSFGYNPYYWYSYDNYGYYNGGSQYKYRSHPTRLRDNDGGRGYSSRERDSYSGDRGSSVGRVSGSGSVNTLSKTSRISNSDRSGDRKVSVRDRTSRTTDGTSRTRIIKGGQADGVKTVAPSQNEDAVSKKVHVGRGSQSSGNSDLRRYKGSAADKSNESVQTDRTSKSAKPSSKAPRARDNSSDSRSSKSKTYSSESSKRSYSKPSVRSDNSGRSSRSSSPSSRSSNSGSKSSYSKPSSGSSSSSSSYGKSSSSSSGSRSASPSSSSSNSGRSSSSSSSKSGKSRR